MDLTTLREANRLRLPQFKNNNGDPAHSIEDGSDWSPRMWLLAIMGELGELSEASNEQSMKDEAADVAIYLDLWAQRALDIDSHTQPGIDDESCHEGLLFGCIALLGRLCEAHKKFRRGDIELLEYMKRCNRTRAPLLRKLTALAYTEPLGTRGLVVSDKVGIDLADAIADKFNRTSRKVGATVFITPDGVRNNE